MVNVVVLVSGGGTNLQALIDFEKAGGLTNGAICAVVSSNREAYALKRAALAGIETFVLEKKDCASMADYETKLIAILDAVQADLIVLAGYMIILSEGFVGQYKNRIMNVHPSLIPSFCGSGFYGLKVHEAALQKGVRISGATVHFVNEIPDDGPIVLQKAVEVFEDDTAEVLQQRVMTEAEHEILPKAVAFFCEGKLRVLGRRVSIDE